MQTRLKTPTLRIDPESPIRFTYRGKECHGYSGDSVASALYANEVRIFSRSFKYHRPRGLFSLDGESASGLMQINRMPNMRAEQTLLQEGMRIEPQNVFGSPDLDLMSVVEKFSPLMPPGFYYKKFHKPYSLWPIFQKGIRKAAGLGRIDPDWDEGQYDALYLHSDLCVIGGGLSGMTAALCAADHGLRVVLLEARPWLGGFHDWQTRSSGTGQSAYQTIRSLAQQVVNHNAIRVLTNTYMSGFYHDNLITAVQTDTDNNLHCQNSIEIRSQSVVVATGCVERPLIFENNERPGVMLSECAWRLVRHYGIQPGSKAVFSVGHDEGIEAALDLADFDVEVLAIADSRHDPLPESLSARIRERSIPVYQGWAALNALGKTSVQGVVLGDLKENTTRKKTFSCDLLVASAGTHPAIQPLLLAHAKPSFDKETGVFGVKELPPGVYLAGRAEGYHQDKGLEASGSLAGLQACHYCGKGRSEDVLKTEKELNSLAGRSNPSKIVRAPAQKNNGAGHKNFVCFDEDVTVKDIRRTIDEGFDAVELCKRYSTVGMGPSQGGIPGMNLPLIMGEYQQKESGDVLPTKMRPPLQPTMLASYLGKKFQVEKQTPLHVIQKKSGGQFMWLGKWKRPRHFTAEEHVPFEVKAVRNQVGIIDVSTLGKFRIYGPDALKALNFLYVSDMTTVRPGKLKYVAMCNEDGCLIDDGVITKIGTDDYYFTTSSGRAAETLAWFRYWTREKNWEYNLINLTDTLGGINIAGPKSRKVLQSIVDQVINNEALPYMGYQEVSLHKKFRAKLLRIGFLGELSYEIHAPASSLQSIWEELLDHGRSQGIAPFGLEAQNILRLEKGHVIIGLDSENKTTLSDVGLGFLWDRKKKDCEAIGIPALRLTENQEGRTKLIGFEMSHSQKIPPDFSLVVDQEIRGHVTAARHSEVLGKSIGLALVEDRLAAVGTSLLLYTGGNKDACLQARVVKTPFYDPEGKRLKM